MKKLNESDVIRIMREEWNSKLRRLSEEVDVTFKGKIDGKEKTLISKGLNLKHKKSLFRYEVVAVGPDEVVLTPADASGEKSVSLGSDEVMLDNPEKEKFTVSKKELEDEYKID